MTFPRLIDVNDDRFTNDGCEHCDGWGLLHDGVSLCLHCDGTGYKRAVACCAHTGAQAEMPGKIGNRS